MKYPQSSLLRVSNKHLDIKGPLGCEAMAVVRLMSWALECKCNIQESEIIALYMLVDAISFLT